MRTVADLAAALGGRLSGDGDRPLTGVAPVETAGPGHVTFVTNPRYLAKLPASRAAAVILASENVNAARPPDMAAILVEDPHSAFAKAAQRLLPSPPRPPVGVHASAVIDPKARLERGVAVGPLTYVGPDAHVGADAVLHAGVHIEAGAHIGAASVLYNRVVVRHGCRIGARCVVHPGAVIGADGFGFARPADGLPLKIPQVGRVIIEDDVEIGANTTIDRGTFDDTRVGRGAKLDNLIQVGHNVSIGEGCILVAQSGVAGSSRIEAGAALGAQAGVSGHITVGAGATVYGQAGVIKDVPPGAAVAGTPAEPRGAFFRAVSRIRKLDGWGERVRELERAVKALSANDQTES